MAGSISSPSLGVIGTKYWPQKGSCTRPMYERKSVIIPDSTLSSLSIEEVAKTAKPNVDRS